LAEFRHLLLGGSDFALQVRQLLGILVRAAAACVIVVVRFARSPGVSGKAGFLGIDPSGLVAARIAPASKSPEELASRLVALPARKMLIA